MARRRLALLGRAIQRTEGEAPAPTEIDAEYIPRLLAFIRDQTSAPHDAVLASIVAGGARYASVVNFRVGDIRGDGAVVLRVTKTGGPCVMRLYPSPGGWIGQRLAAWGGEPPGVRWLERPRLWPRGVTEASMRAVAPARQTRRAAAQLAEGALGEATNTILGHSSLTRQTNYSHRPAPERAAWAAVVRGASEARTGRRGETTTEAPGRAGGGGGRRRQTASPGSRSSGLSTAASDGPRRKETGGAR